MDTLIDLIISHAQNAHWYIFIAIILAGFNIPFSADLLILAAALLVATVVPENAWLLFFSFLVGAYISASCAYWLGRLVGGALSKRKFFAKLLSPEKIGKIKQFYEKYGLWTLVFGRFIPFGVRNCIFMSSGMSKLHYGKFLLMDALACSLWCSIVFYVFYTLGQNYDTILHYLRTFNLMIFAAFIVAGIGFIWYKGRKKKTRDAAAN